MTDFVVLEKDSEAYEVVVIGLREMEYPYYSYGLTYPEELTRTMSRFGLKPIQKCLDDGEDI